MGSEDLENEEAPIKNNVEFSGVTVKIEKLPEMEFAKVQASPKSKSLVSRFEGLFYS